MYEVYTRTFHIRYGFLTGSPSHFRFGRATSFLPRESTCQMLPTSRKSALAKFLRSGGLGPLGDYRITQRKQGCNQRRFTDITSIVWLVLRSVPLFPDLETCITGFRNGLAN